MKILNLPSNADFDVHLINLPSYTSQTPSLALVSLATFLKQKNFDIFLKDYSLEFFKNKFKNVNITNKLNFNIPSFFLFGVSNWLNFSEELFNDNKIPENLIQSLCPVSYNLYKDIFIELKKQKDKIQADLDKYIKEISSISSKILGFSVNVGNAAASLYVAKAIKESNSEKKIIFGGPETFLEYRSKFYLTFPYIDAIIFSYQGEIPFYEVLKSNKNLKNIKGVGFKKDHEFFFTEPAPSIELNKLPIPDYSLIKINDKFDLINIQLSRGCLSSCAFCNEKSLFNGFFRKSPSRIIEELEYYIKNGYHYFETIDTSFNHDVGLYKQILEKIRENRLNIKWGGNAECSKMSEKLLEKSINSGLTHCYYGIESGSETILKLMKKNIRLSEANKIIKKGFELDLEQYIYLIVGYPGENEKEYQKTKNMLLNYTPYIKDSIISVYTLLNGSEMFTNKMLKPIKLSPDLLNAFTYESLDGITHDVRKKRFLELKNIKKNH
ncbi:MAG: radical SAM protein [Candidatus Lokiarchaeota archaeon]|nr:radical SAM protein [Candidatus Lokiarchaeota archaeon]